MSTPHSYILSAIAALAVVGAANAQTSSSTPVIGYYKASVPMGTSLWTSGFVTKTEFQGLATSVTPGALTSTVARTGAGFGNYTTLPHYLEVLNGASAGMIFDIVAGGDANSVVVKGNLAGIAATVKFAVRKHATLGSLFPVASGFIDSSDQLIFYRDNGTSVSVLPAGDGSWVDAADTELVRTGEVIYPGQGFIIVATAARTVTFGGNEVSYVKTTPTRIPLYGGKPNLVGLINPLVPDASTLGQFGFTGLQADDLVTVYTNNAGTVSKQGSYITDAGQVYDAADTELVKTGDSYKIGSALLIQPAADRLMLQPIIHPIN